MEPAPVAKKSPGRMARLARLVLSTVDPRAWLHLVRMVNYYNYSHVEPRRRMKAGGGCAISPDAVFSNAERIELGERVRIGSRCHLWAGHAHAKVIVGDDVLFGPEVLVTAASYRFNDGQPVTEQRMDEADVTIGADVWLGTRAIVLPGVTIGEGAIIGAGALVRDDIPPFAIAVGQPARVVSQREIAGPTGGSPA